MAIKKNQKFKKGIIIIEVLIAIFIIGLVFAGLSQTIVSSLRVSTLLKENIEANNLVQATIEQVRNFRDGTNWQINGLGTLKTNIPYYPQKTRDVPPKWTLIEGQEKIGIFTRWLIFENVQRDVNDNIVEEGGNIDPNSKKIISNISWRDKKVQVITYLTNWQE